MSKKSKSTEGGAGGATILTIAFIVLKLCKVISWSWVWVLSPLWIPIALVILGFIPFILYQTWKKK